MRELNQEVSDSTLLLWCIFITYFLSSLFFSYLKIVHAFVFFQTGFFIQGDAWESVSPSRMI
jgi:hypothetical protein